MAAWPADLIEHPLLGYRLPHALSAPLFGDRRQFGLEIRDHDPDWIAWQALCWELYERTQRRGLGRMVNDAGYRILGHVDLDAKRVLEIGPGFLPHRRFWRGRPCHYTVIDIRQDALDRSMAGLREIGIPTAGHLASAIPGSLDDSIDTVLTFYSLEHLHPLDPYLAAIKRVLRPGGLIAGAIPAEGGLAWGCGRLLTTRRYIKKHTSIDPDKIICWEHRNFADAVLTALDRHFERLRLEYWPLHLPLIDGNLVIRFLYRSSPASLAR
jgi:SAM-dependent methyltransferase